MATTTSLRSATTIKKIYYVSIRDSLKQADIYCYDLKSKKTVQLTKTKVSEYSPVMSSDGKYLVSGGRDRRLGVWDAEKNEWIRSFGGHRDTITVSLGLCFYNMVRSALTD